MPKIESTSQISKVAKMEVATPSGLLWQIESWDHKQHLKKKKKPSVPPSSHLLSNIADSVWLSTIYT